MLTAAKSKHRCIPRTSSGLELPRGIDFRTVPGRRFRDLYMAYAAELGAPLSEPEKAIVRQAVALQMAAERMQEQILRGETVDSDMLIRLSGTSKRLLGIIAAKTGKRPEAQGSELDAYLAEHYADDADTAVAEPEPISEL